MSQNNDSYEEGLTMSDKTAIVLDNEESDLLRTYADGPRIWDATSVFQKVMKLEAKKLVTPADGSNGLYELTAAGRAVVAGLR